MTSLNFPDVNVWLALVIAEHVHRQVAGDWWRGESGQIAFIRSTQISVLRLLTTPAAMNNCAMSMTSAWSAVDRLFEDDRVALIGEPVGIEPGFRDRTSANASSPKLWADAWLLAFAESANGRVVTFDRALAAQSGSCLLL